MLDLKISTNEGKTFTSDSPAPDETFEECKVVSSKKMVHGGAAMTTGGEARTAA